MNERITADPRVCNGHACVKGTSIPVYQVIRMMANGKTFEEIIKEHSSLKRDDILACLDYSASLMEKRITSIETDVIHDVVQRVWRTGERK